jgi:hypothetical protein
MRFLGLFLIAVAVVTGLIGVAFLVAAFAVNKDQNQQAEPCLLFGAIVIILGAVVALVIGIVVMRRGKPWDGKGSTVPAGTPVGNYKASVPIERTLDGVSYSVLYTPPVKGKHARPSVLRISTAVDVDGEFEIVPESGFDRFAKKWGLAREIQTFDESFDHHCFVRSDTVEFAEAYLGNGDNRGIIANLHEMGFKSVMMKDREIKAEWAGFDPIKNDTPDLNEEVGARLILLARKLPADLPEPDLTAAKRRRFWQVWLWGFLIAFAVTILSLIAFPPIRASDLFLRAAPVGLLSYPLFALLAAILLKGTSRSHYAWRTLAIVAVALIPVGSLGTIAGLNGMLDNSPAVEHEARIIRKYTTRNKNKTNYHVECTSWRNPAETESFQISSGEYSKVVEGQSNLLVTTHNGWLGMEWVKGKHVGQPKRQ